MTVIALPRTASGTSTTSVAENLRDHPLAVLLVRRGPVGIRYLGALSDDRRIELVVTDELTPDWVSVAQRLAAVIVATMDDPLGALLYTLTAGVTTPVVVATSGQHRRECETTLAAGAAACVVMPIRPPDCQALVSMLVARAAATRVDSTLRLVIDPVARTARYQDRNVQLSQREFAVLHCLSSRSGRPVAADELLMYVWGERPSPERSRQILDVYIFQLRKKLERLGLKGAIATIRGFGYMLVPVAGAERTAAG